MMATASRLLLLLAGLLSAMSVATPPPPASAGLTVRLPANQCRLPLEGMVAGYVQPLYVFDVDGPTIVRILADEPNPALLIELEHIDKDQAPHPVVGGAGLAGGDIRVALPLAGRYHLRVLMIGDAARAGRTIPYRLSLSRALGSGAPECPA